MPHAAPPRSLPESPAAVPDAGPGASQSRERLGRERTLRVDPDAAAPLDDAAARGEGAHPRYVIGDLLGAGGMGEVRLCLDTHIGRDVARKQLGATASDEGGARFLREARIQGQLEHPAVVPVYDLGRDADGARFFTMKRVRGVTLAEVLDGLARRDPDAVARYSRRRLLTALSTVCLAVDFAHARSVVHRDLKPANIMLGAFGEVHVLDWGLAKVVEPARGSAVPPVAVAGSAVATSAGAILGTPGYMAPEQARGDADRVDARADVYALGAILYEVLTLRPLHEGPGLRALMVSTLGGVDARASVRAPDADVPPELEQLCLDATALEPADRCPSARALAEAIERYLDGDRDLERRRALVAAHTAVARDATAVALAGGADAEAARVRAVRAASQALALDPTAADATRLLAQLLATPPATMPAEARAAYDAAAARSRRAVARMGALAFGTWFLFDPVTFWMGVRSWTAAAVPTALLAGALGYAAWMWRAGRTTDRHGVALLVLSSLAIAALSGIAGPFVLVPAIAVMNVVFFAMHADRRQRWLVALCGALTVALPVVFEALALVEPAYTFHDGVITIHPRLLHLPPTATRVFLLAASLALVLTPALLVGRLRDALADAERGLFLHLWHLRQVVPDDVRRELTSDHPPPPPAART